MLPKLLLAVGKASAWGRARGGVALAVAKWLEGTWGQTKAVGTNPSISPNRKRAGQPIQLQFCIGGIKGTLDGCGGTSKKC